MDEAEFDRFADEYEQMHRQNIRASGEAPEFFAHYKIRDIRDALDRGGWEPRTFLDFGGGIGASLPFISQYFPACDITVADVSERSLNFAAQRNVPKVRPLLFDGQRVPLEGGSQDVILAACVFHHIPEDRHVALFQELYRLLSPGGALFVFEHNPLNPLTVQAVNTCPFDENAVLIRAPELRRRIVSGGFSQSKTDVHYRIFFPHALKALRPLERLFRAVPLGAQYSVQASK